MAAGNLTLDIYRFCDFTQTFSCKDVDGAAFSLSGWSVEAQIRRAIGAAGLIMDLAPEITSASGGEITISLTAEQTQGLSEGKYRWDMVLITPDGERLAPLLSGECLVHTAVTRGES